MNEEFEVIVTSVVVIPKGKTILEDGGTTISVEDDGDRKFVHVTQPAARGINIDSSEWETIKSAVDMLLGNLRE